MNGGRLEIRLKPRSKSDRVGIAEDGTIAIAVTSPPVDEKANRHLLELLAERLGVPKSTLSLIRGKHGRNKTVALQGLTKNDAIRRLSRGLNG